MLRNENGRTRGYPDMDPLQIQILTVRLMTKKNFTRMLRKTLCVVRWQAGSCLAAIVRSFLFFSKSQKKTKKCRRAVEE